jgi:hypothetical protein
MGMKHGRSSGHGMVKNFLFSTPSRLALEAHTALYPMRIGLFPRGKAAGGGGEALHSPPASAEVNKTPPDGFMAWCSTS